MENYLVVYDFENTTIGFNGYVLGELIVEPERPPAEQPNSNTTLIAILVIGAIIAVGIAVATVVFIKKRNKRLQQNLSQYNKLEENGSGASEIY